MTVDGFHLDRVDGIDAEELSERPQIDSQGGRHEDRLVAPGLMRAKGFDHRWPETLLEPGCVVVSGGFEGRGTATGQQPMEDPALDPVAAIDWANSISQDDLRNRTLTRAGQQLFRRDAEAARDWVVSSGLPPEAQQAVLNPPRRR